MAPIGDNVNHSDSCENSDIPLIQARGTIFLLAANLESQSNSAAAPSEIELELAAVRVPFSLNAGFKSPILFTSAFKGCSSAFITFNDFFVFTVTSQISSLKSMFSTEYFALLKDSMAYASCSDRPN